MHAPFEREPATSLFDLSYTKTSFADNFGIEVITTGWPKKQCAAPYVLR
jgi:hypothetical protein